MFADNERGSKPLKDTSIMSKSSNGMNSSMMSGGGRQVYESDTIKKQYADYIILKSETLKKANYTMMMSYIFMLTFAVYLLLTVIFIFTN